MFDTERFIVEKQDRPALYDVQSKYYANCELKAKLWMEIAQEVVAHWADLGPEDKDKAGEESPLPEVFQKELIQLQDLLGDVLSEHLVEDIPDALDSAYQEKPIKAAPETLTVEFKTSDSFNKSTSTQTVHSKSLKITQALSGSIADDVQNTPMPSPIPMHNENCENQFCASCIESIVPQDIYENINTPSEYHSFSNIPTPSSTTSTRRKTYKTDKGKKRLVHKDRWVTVQRKQKKNTGQEFVNKKGKVVEEKELKDPCSDKCRLKCRKNLSHQDRLRIFTYFWRLGDKQRHWEFVIRNTKKSLKRRQTTEITIHNRQNTLQYFLPNSEKRAVKVCKTMFLNTISLSERVVTTAWKKYDGNTVMEEDKRGRYAHSKRVYNDDMVKSVCDHVRCFPAVKSYSYRIRKDSNKLYLEGIESVSRMFNPASMSQGISYPGEI